MPNYAVNGVQVDSSHRQWYQPLFVHPRLVLALCLLPFPFSVPLSLFRFSLNRSMKIKRRRALNPVEVRSTYRDPRADATPFPFTPLVTSGGPVRSVIIVGLLA